jgi:ribosomal protein S1
MDFGAFVELTPGIVGLVHASEVGYSAGGDPQQVVKAGENVLVRILEIDAERERVSLSMRRVPKDIQIAWMSEEFDSGATSTEPEDNEAPPE